MGEDLFVSSVEGHAVTRLGTGSRVAGIPQPGLLIGAERDPLDPSKVTWFPNRVVCVPAAEAFVFRREYQRAIADESLKRRTREDFEAQERRIGEEQRQAREEAAAKAQAATEQKGES